MISIVSLSLLAFLVYTTQYQNQTPAPAPSNTPVQQTVVKTPPKQEPIPPELIKVTLDSTPSQAKVYDPALQTVRGQTPWYVDLEKDASLSVELQMEGYQSEKVTLFSSSPELMITLTPLPKKKSNPSQKTSSPTKPAKKVDSSKPKEIPSPPKGFKKETSNPFD